MKRRSFLHASAVAIAAGAMRPALGDEFTPTDTTQVNKDGFFTLGRVGDRWALLDPQRRPFFSVGLNHIDPASLRYPENLHLWRDKYGNSMRRWLTESVRPNLLDWGFNCVGWNQEVITRRTTNHRHSRHFTFEEYQWLDMPYCHQLPFADFHQWEVETVNPDFFSSGFSDWCDHVAREHCAVFANDSKLIGYFYVDCPTWLHIRRDNQWRGPLFDIAKLDSHAGREELTALAAKYYQVTHDAIRRYDPHHLILGDRYEANAPLTMEIVRAAKPFVDVLSFQDFKDPVIHLALWHQRSGMPVLWADGARGIAIDDTNKLRNDGRWWAEQLRGLRQLSGCVGAHLCGAYGRNRVRRRGLIDENDGVDTEMVNIIREANQRAVQWDDNG